VNESNIKKINLAPGKWIYYLFCGALFVMPMGTSPFTIVGGCILAIWIFAGEFVKKREGYLGKSWFWPMSAMIVLVLLGLIWSPEPFGLGLKYAKKTHYWLYALAVASISFTKNPIENLIKAFLFGLFLNSMVGFLQWGNLVPRFSRYGDFGYTGFYGGYNTLAVLLILGLMTASFYFRTVENKKEKLIYTLLMLSYFIQLILIESRGGYLALALLSPIIMHNVFHGKRLFYMFLAYALAIGIMLSSPVIQDRAAQTIEDIQGQFGASGEVKWGKKYSKQMDRIYMWRWAIDLFMEHPLIGVGTGGYKQAILSGGGEKGIAHPHNNLLHMAVSYGIVGVAVFIWFFWVLLKNGWQNRGSVPGFFILSSGLVILVGGLTDTHILDAGGIFLLAVTTGFQAALPEEKGNSSATKDSRKYKLTDKRGYLDKINIDLIPFLCL